MSVSDWARIVRGLAEQVGAEPEVLFLALVAYDITLKAGGRSQEGGYPAALSSVAEALGRERGELGQEVMTRLVRRSCTARAVGRVGELRDVMESFSEVANVVGFEPRNPMDHVVLARRYASLHGLPLPAGRVYAQWRRLLAGLMEMGGVDPVMLALLVRSRTVTMIGGEELRALDDDDADATVASALQSGAGRQKEHRVQEFSGASLEAARPLGRELQEVDYLLYSFQEVIGVLSLERADLPTWLAKVALEHSEIRAPWRVFPDGPGAMLWRMGPGEDHMDAWLAFWRALSEEERRAYLADCEVPDDWRKWLETIA